MNKIIQVFDGNGGFYPTENFINLVKTLDEADQAEDPNGKLQELAHESNVLLVLGKMIAEQAPLWAIKEFLKWVS